MGTRAHIVVEGAQPGSAEQTAEGALRAIERADALLSTWDPSTPLSELNRGAVGTWQDVPVPLWSVVSEVDAWVERTSGAFDPRIGALVDAWGLRESGRVPTAEQLAAARGSAGAAVIELVDGRMRRHADAAWVDAGGFGKGAALREVARTLTSFSSANLRVLVDLGGQVLAVAPEEAPWQVAVAHPHHRHEPVAVLGLHNVSVATSGASERGRHILDPRDGRPVDAWGSVSVVHSDPMVADILSTALYVMGPEAGPTWAERGGVAALFLTATDDHIERTSTTHMEPWLLSSGIN